MTSATLRRACLWRIDATQWNLQYVHQLWSNQRMPVKGWVAIGLAEI
jgi:hypothetical protein